MCISLVSCKEKQEVLPDFSGTYYCSLSVGSYPRYSASSYLVIKKSATGNDYSVSGTGIFANMRFIAFSSEQVQVSLPQAEFIHNNATCYLTFWVTLNVSNGQFTPYNGQLVFGEKGVNSEIYSPKEVNFRFLKN